MTGVIYLSEEMEPFSVRGLRDLAAHSSEKNAKVGLTGYLFYQRGRFIQYLEGPREALEQVFGRIEKDKRHEMINVVSLGDFAERRFPDWGMHFLTEEQISMIRLEDVLESVLNTMRQEIFSEEQTRQTVLRLVNRISSRQHLLPA